MRMMQSTAGIGISKGHLDEGHNEIAKHLRDLSDACLVEEKQVYLHGMFWIPLCMPHSLS